MIKFLNFAISASNKDQIIQVLNNTLFKKECILIVLTGARNEDGTIPTYPIKGFGFDIEGNLEFYIDEVTAICTEPGWFIRHYVNTDNIIIGDEYDTENNVKFKITTIEQINIDKHNIINKAKMDKPEDRYEEDDKSNGSFSKKRDNEEEYDGMDEQESGENVSGDEPDNDEFFKAEYEAKQRALLEDDEELEEDFEKELEK